MSVVIRQDPDHPTFAAPAAPADFGTGRGQLPPRQTTLSYGRLARIYIELPETLQKLVMAHLDGEGTLHTSRLGNDACIHRMNGLVQFWCADEAQFSGDGRRDTLCQTLDREIRAAVEKHEEEFGAEKFGWLRPGCRRQAWQEKQIAEACDKFRAERLEGLRDELEKRLEPSASWTYKGRGRWTDEASGAEVLTETRYLRLEVHLGGIEQVAPAFGAPVVAVTDTAVDEATVAACRRKGVTIARLGADFQRFLDEREERLEAAAGCAAVVPTI
jgi:hypothetical protein